jgi:hypothetical protein
MVVGPRDMRERSVDHAEAILASGAAQRAASNRPLPGAVPALLLYDRYFPGENPDR